MFFRASLAVHVLLILSQPVWIGLFLSGDSSKLTVHEMMGSAVWFTSVPVIVAAILVWRWAKWPGATVWMSVLLLVLETVQLTVGYDRHLGLHVPLGVGLAVGTCFLYAWAYKPHGRATDDQPAAGTVHA